MLDPFWQLLQKSQKYCKSECGHISAVWTPKQKKRDTFSSSTLILAIGGGVLGLIIIGLIIYYAVQRGKTKQQALKANN